MAWWRQLNPCEGTQNKIPQKEYWNIILINNCKQHKIWSPNFECVVTGNMCALTFTSGKMSCVLEKGHDYSHLRQHPSCVRLGETPSPPSPSPTGHKPTPQTFLGLSGTGRHVLPPGPPRLQGVTIKGCTETPGCTTACGRKQWIKDTVALPSHTTLTLINTIWSPNFECAKELAINILPLPANDILPTTRRHLCSQ